MSHRRQSCHARGHPETEPFLGPGAEGLEPSSASRRDAVSLSLQPTPHELWPTRRKYGFKYGYRRSQDLTHAHVVLYARAQAHGAMACASRELTSVGATSSIALPANKPIPLTEHSIQPGEMVWGDKVVEMMMRGSAAPATTMPPRALPVSSRRHVMWRAVRCCPN